jgi:peptide-methionine (R)-S-oxide reductase
MDNDQMPKTEEEFKHKLTPEQYDVMRKGGTETPFTGQYYNDHEKGMYVCAACGQELFSSDTKFDSGTGWPSFTDPVNLKNVTLHRDESGGMVRTEVRCGRCGSHLGHVFDDGPADKGGKRYCINSVCLLKRPTI